MWREGRATAIAIKETEIKKYVKCIDSGPEPSGFQRIGFTSKIEEALRFCDKKAALNMAKALNTGDKPRYRAVHVYFTEEA